MKKLISFLIKKISLGFSYCLFNSPSFLKRAVVRLFTFLLFDVFRFRRKVVDQNTEICFSSWSKPERLKMARESAYKQIWSVLEFFQFPWIDEKWIQKNVVVHNFEILDRALEQKQGVLVLSAHLGHGDISISMLAHRGYKINVISKFFSVKWLNDLWYGLRTRFGARFIAPHGSDTAFQIFKCLRKNELVVFVIDQFMGPPEGVEVQFFGQSTGAAYGLALFALKTGAPVLPVYGVRDRDGVNHIYIEEPIPMQNQGDKEQTIAHMTQVYTDKIQQLVQKYPADWMWYHRRFKSFRNRS